MSREISHRRHRRGAAIVETAIILNICLAFLLGTFDFARVIMMRQLLENAAREGLRSAIVSTDSLTTADIQAIVTQRLAGQGLSNMTINVYKADPLTGANLGAWTDAALGEYIAVDISGTYNPLAPLFSRLSSQMPLQMKVMTCSEAN